MAKTTVVARPSKLSQERVQDSSDGDDSPSEEVTRKVKAPKAPKASKGHPSASREIKNASKPSKKSKAKSPSPASEPESTDESSEIEDAQDDSDDDSATSSASSRKRAAPAVAESLPKKKTKTTTSSAVQIAPKPFTAPPGYAPVIASASDYASEVGALFDGLSGKQIWHISVPDSVSIESIKELDIEAAMKGEPILSNNGIDYNMRSVDTKEEIVLLPTGPKMSYRQNAKTVERSFLLQEMRTRPKSKDESSLVFTATQSGESKPVRKQPEGLKMRYVPYGAPAIQELPDEDQDVEMGDSFEMPPELNPTSPRTKSKKTKPSKGGASEEKSPKKKAQAPDEQVSPEKKKKKKRRLVDENVL